VWLLRFQVGVPYFFGGIAKIDGDWLRAEPMRGWLADRTDFPLVGRWFTDEWMVYAMNYGGLLLDLLVVPALLWRRTRPFAFAAAVVFHVTNARLFQIGIFPWFMIAATTIFLDPGWPRRLFRRPAVRPPAGAPAPLGRALALFLAAWVAVQVLVPLRHYLYRGVTNWTEQGHTFSWHMKLRAKQGSVRFYAVDKRTGERRRIRMRDFISHRQYDKMSTRPYMIRQFARFLADELERSGDREVEIRVESFAALNGRERQRLIDPEVDLAAQPYSLLHAEWIVPLATPLKAGAGDADSEERD
jgi:hypothetical protein